MSFRDNLQHLRATRNMTQEQLAMLLGVSRQSVSKWEAERAYPEMDKLLKLCDLFGCTLDELVSGDLMGRPVDAASSMPSGKAPQDVTGYDQTMRAFAWKVSLGVAIVILGAALARLIPDIVSVSGIEKYTGVTVFIGIGVGIALILPAWFARSGFRKAHPFVEDFYTVEQKSQARSRMLAGLVTGIGCVMIGFAVILLLQTVPWLSSSVFLMLLAVGAFSIIYGCLTGMQSDIEAYNRKSLYVMKDSQVDALDDEELQVRARRIKREKGIYKVVMWAATAVALVLLFVPQLKAQPWFWLAWVVGGVVCVAINTYRSMRSED